ncbi:MAG: polysaccharide pyruvyl transferase family protein [Gammaproteobacteria bacterium]|nr:polysaccharide pyruvyl transferase family protein [Gammaproteobacteria bacterium]
MKKNREFVYSLATQHENLGDLLINQQLIGWLKDYASIVIEEKDVPNDFLYAVAGRSVVKASSNPAKYAIKSKTFYLSNLLSNPKVDGIVLSPGHLGNSNIRLNIKKGLVLLVSLYLRTRGVRTYRVGVSLGHIGIMGGIIESFSTLIFEVYGVRDKYSQRKLLPFARKLCVIVPDLSFLAAGTLESLSTNVKHADKVVFSIRGDRRPPNSSKTYEKQIYNDIPLQASRKFNQVLCYSQVAFDRDEQRKLERLLSEHGHATNIAEEYCSIETAASHLADAKAVISNRLHVLLPAMMLGTLALCIGSYHLDAKIFAIYEDMGLDDLIYDIENPKQEFPQFLNNAIENRAAYLVKIKQSVLEQSEKINSLMAKVIK